ncbi:hypothetical protein [Phormidesmis priestleyi]|nr:hypothetical protein [Phormidesmis priestleyi]
MKQQEIRYFLNLPGIAGVALMDGRSRSFLSDIRCALIFGKVNI